jgi:inhibitor of KinA
VSFELTPLGDSVLIVRLGDSLGEVLTATQKLEAARIVGVTEIAPAFASVGIFFDGPRDLDSVATEIRTALQKRARRREKSSEPRLVKIPVCYEQEFAPDLDEVATHCRLSPNELVKRHASARYCVRCVGFTPGFPYLGGLPRELAMPRRDSPRTSVPAGSVAIGGRQTGVYPLPSPGGWNIIGRTPLRLFDPARDPAALLRTGDRVRFLAITAEQFEQWPA